LQLKVALVDPVAEQPPVFLDIDYLALWKYQLVRELLIHPIKVIVLLDRLPPLVVVQVQILLHIADEGEEICGLGRLVLRKVHLNVIHQGLDVVV
jgi:hypothetical protein